MFLSEMVRKTKDVQEEEKVSSPSQSATLKATTRELNQIRHALDQSAIVAITDRAGRIIHVNDKFCEISQFRREELLGQNHRIINSGYHSPEFFIEMWKTISSGKTWEGEIRNRAKDGSIYWVNTTIVPFMDVRGEPTQYVSIRYEITQRKNAEEQLRIYADRLERSNQELQEVAAHRAQALQAVLEREAQIVMQDRLASVGLLASSLAHEIGTPLGVIRGRAEYLGLQIPDDPAVNKNVEVIIAQIDRVSKLIRSLLNLARGDQIHSAVQVDLKAVVGEVVDLMGPELRKHSIELTNELTQNTLVNVRAEAGPLHQVFLNLLVNSVHAIDSSVKQGRTSGHFIRVSAQSVDTNWVIQVEDSGCGISEKNLKNLFKPFFTTKDIGLGTGLGLATSYRIVESWGGSIQVSSVEGKGSEFRVLLPQAKADS